MSSAPSLYRTALYANHLAANGRMVPFAGWSMPVQYTGVLSEAKAVRTNVGIFDVSHMAQITLEGAGTEALLEKLTPTDVGANAEGRVR